MLFQFQILQTLAGEKYSATKWIHVSAFNTNLFQSASRCDDTDSNCGDWALKGECEHNPDWMAIHCAKSCGKCQHNHLSAPSETQVPGLHGRVVYLGRKAEV